MERLSIDAYVVDGFRESTNHCDKDRTFEIDGADRVAAPAAQEAAGSNDRCKCERPGTAGYAALGAGILACALTPNTSKSASEQRPP